MPCEHYYVSTHEPGHRVYWVRVCQLCHRVDWDDLDDEIDAAAPALRAQGAAAEREACAQLAEQSQVCPDVRAFANQIRARTNPTEGTPS